MKYAVDKIDNNIVLLESLLDKTKKEVSINILPDNIKEGSIITYENNIYTKDEEQEQQRRTIIKNKFDMLKKRKVDNS